MANSWIVERLFSLPGRRSKIIVEAIKGVGVRIMGNGYRTTITFLSPQSFSLGAKGEDPLAFLVLLSKDWSEKKLRTALQLQEEKKV